MERRFLLTLLLFAALFFGYKLFADSGAQKPPAKPTDSTTKEADAPGGNPAAPAPAGPPPATPAPPPGPPPAGPAPSEPVRASAVLRADESAGDFVITPPKGEFARLVFTPRGGALVAATLRNSYELAEREVPAGEKHWQLDLVAPVDRFFLSLMLTPDERELRADKGEKKAAYFNRNRTWTVDSKTDTEVVFSTVTDAGLRIRKTIRVPTEADRFDLDVKIDVDRVSGLAAPNEPPQRIFLLGVAGVLRESPPMTSSEDLAKDSAGVQPLMQIASTHDEPRRELWSITPPVPLSDVQRTTHAFRFAGVTTPYYLAALCTSAAKTDAAVAEVWIDGGDANNRAIRDQLKSYDGLAGWYRQAGHDPAADEQLAHRLSHASWHFHRVWCAFDAPVGSTAAPSAGSTFRLYLGPLSRRVFRQDRYEALAPIITYPAAPDFVATLLLIIFDLWNGLFSSAGLAIVLMTLTVRGGLMPLSIRNQLSMRRQAKKLAKVKPKLDALKERYANNPKKLRTEQQALMREHGVGFPMGCVMMFLQIPIFFSLFSSLRVEFDIRHASFLWIKDLAGPDRLVDFGRNLLPFLPASWGGLHGINLLPIVYIAFSIYQQRLMPPPQDEQQAQQMKMMRWMSIVFSILLYNYTAALALYMCVSSLIALIEGRIVRSKDPSGVTPPNAGAAIP